MLIETIPSRDGGLQLIGGLGPLFLDNLLERAPWRIGWDSWAEDHEWRVCWSLRLWFCRNRPYWPNLPPGEV